MREKVKLIFQAYKEIQGLIVDSIQLLFYIVAGFHYLLPFFTNITSKPLYIKIIIFLVIFIFIITIYRNWKRIKNKAVYKVEYANFLLGQKIDKKEKTFFYNFEKIIPSEKILNYLNEEISNELKKWSDDIIPVGADLEINNRNKNFQYALALRYYSPFKKITVRHVLKEFKIGKKNIFENCDLTYNEKNLPHVLFFKNNQWRKAIIKAFSYIESELIGKTFACYISDGLNEVKIHIIPDYDSGVSRSFSFYYENNELKDHNDTIINFES